MTPNKSDIVYRYEEAPTLYRFSESDRFVRGIMGPIGSGKSSACVIECLKRGMAQAPGPDGVKRTRFVVIRNTYGQLEDTSMKTFFQWCPPWVFGKHVKHDYMITNIAPGTEIEILFRALDRPDHVRNLLSLELTGAWVNEAREIPYAIIKALRGRVGRYPSAADGGPTWHGVWMDTNPPDEDSWWYRYFEEMKPDNAELFRQPSGMSPAAENKANLPVNYYENLMEGSDDEWIKVYVHGEYGFIIEGKPVYSSYRDAVHCVDAFVPIKNLPIRRGWDFGLTPACTFSQFTPSGHWHIFDELIADDMGVERFSDDLLEYCQREYAGFRYEDYGDPAGNSRSQTDERTCFQILTGKGIDIQPGLQDPTIRQESVRFALNKLIDGKPCLQISSKCRTLRKGFMGGYQLRRLQTSKERYAEKPEKNMYSHPHDALQYDATMLFGEVVREGAKAEDMKPKGYDPYADYFDLEDYGSLQTEAIT